MKHSIRFILIAAGLAATTCSSPLSAAERQGTTPEWDRTTKGDRLLAKPAQEKTKPSSASPKKAPSKAKSDAPAPSKPSKPKSTPKSSGKTTTSKSTTTTSSSKSDAYFKRLDADGDRRITLAEYVERRPGRKVSKSLLANIFTEMDRDANGYLTPAEFARSRSKAA